MATINAVKYSLLDVNTRKVNGALSEPIIELLTQENSIVNDIPWIECNTDTGHQTILRTGIPAATWRKLYAGVATTKSTVNKIIDTPAMIEARSELDVDVIPAGGDVATFRAQEAAVFMQGLSQQVASALIYETALTQTERFVGFASRYSALSAANSDSILSGGGVGSDNSSIYLIGWGERTAHGLYSKGASAGFEHKDLGESDAFDASNNRYRAYMDIYKWKCGLTVRDWRSVVRICNLDTSNMLANTSAPNLVSLMIDACNRQRGGGDKRFYMNRATFGTLQKQAAATSANVLAVEAGLSQFGTGVMSPASFLGIPIMIEDALLTTEATVV